MFLKKSLGQHFLKDESVSMRIVNEVLSSPHERLLEVGPGGGALTKYLLKAPGIDFKAIEIDDEKIAFLLQTYPELQGKLLRGDILSIQAPFNLPFSVVGNFPYNISTQIVFRIIEWREQISCAIGMFQKEVAERITAREGSKVYGVTSVLTQAFFDTSYLFEVDEEAFNPPPKVKSAVIKLLPRKELLEIKSERNLFMLVKTAFGQRRKTLRNAVRGLFKPDVLADSLFDKRAEQLSVLQFAALTFEMN